jgi:hypothetical protein
VLAPALTDEEGRLQALWVFNLATDPSGTQVELRPCARREPADACGYGETEAAEVP